MKGAIVALQWANRMHGFDSESPCIGDPALVAEPVHRAAQMKTNDAGLARMNELGKLILADKNYLKFPNLRPKDAATLILVDRAGPVPKVLLGKRHHGHKFMPGKYVFPGGGLEPDGQARAGCAWPRPPRRSTPDAGGETPERRQGARARARGDPRDRGGNRPHPGRAQGLAATMPDGHWAMFAQARILPDLGAVHFIARAITPPRRPKRFDARFFAVDASAIAHRIDGIIGPDAELVDLVWMPIAEARQLDMPTITGVVLEELEMRVAEGFGHDLPVPFYQMRHRRFVRELL